MTIFFKISSTQVSKASKLMEKAIQLIKEIKGEDKNPVMGQEICPMAPLSYDQEGLINLTVLVEEEQDITISPCTLSFMNGSPEYLYVQTMFYEVCCHFEIKCVLCRCLSDGTRNDYQGGFESFLLPCAICSKLFRTACIRSTSKRILQPTTTLASTMLAVPTIKPANF